MAERGSRGIDFEKMEAAFRRAAYKAVHGTREERSGRFMISGERSSSFSDNRSKSSAGSRHRARQSEAGKGP